MGKPYKIEPPKFGGVKDLSGLSMGRHYEPTNYREMGMPSAEVKIIVGRVLSQIRRDKGYRTSEFAQILKITPNLLAVREHGGLNTMDRFIEHCEALRVDPVKVFADCLYLHKKNLRQNNGTYTRL